MRLVNLKPQIKKLAKDFGLKYNSNWFDYMWISKRDEIILQYIGNCLDNVYDKYGDCPEGRIKNISKFFKNDLKKLSKRYGGEVYSQESLEYQKMIINDISNIKIRKEIQELLIRIHKHLTSNKITLITKTNLKKEKEGISRILRHEFIHILLFNNNIEFGKINKNIWMYDEGLCCYMEAYLDDTINLLEARFKKLKYPYEKQYYGYSLKYKKLLKNTKTPKQRKNVILRLYESFK